MFKDVFVGLPPELREELEEKVEQQVYEIIGLLDAQKIDGLELNLVKLCCSIRSTIRLAQSLQDRDSDKEQPL